MDPGYVISDASSPMLGTDADVGENDCAESITRKDPSDNSSSAPASEVYDDGLGQLNAASLFQSISFDDIQFFPPPNHGSLRLQSQFQFHQNQLNDLNNLHLATNLSCFDTSGLVDVSGGCASSFSLIGDSTSGDIDSTFSESPFVFPDNVMEYGETAQFFPGNCVGYLETILEEDDEDYEQEGCSGRHWWIADSDTDTDSVIRVDNNGLKNSVGADAGGGGLTTIAQLSECEKNFEIKPHFRSSASSKPFELEDLHLFDQLDYAFEETLREPGQRSFPIVTEHQPQSIEFHNAVKSSLLTGESYSERPSEVGDDIENKTASCLAHQQIFIGNRNNNERHSGEVPANELKTLTHENVRDHIEEIISKDGQEGKELSNKKHCNSESRETFGSSMTPSSSESETPAEVAEEDFFYSSPGSSEEEESCSSDDSEKTGVVLAEFSLGSAGGSNEGSPLNSSGGGTGMFFGNPRNRRSFESPSRLKSFRSFDSLNCLAGTELLFSKPDSFPSIHHIREVSEPSSESDSNEMSVVEDETCLVFSKGDQDEIVRKEAEPTRKGKNLTEKEESRSFPSQRIYTPISTAFPGASLHHNTSLASSSSMTEASSTSGSGLRSTENLSEDSGISITPVSTPGAFMEDTKAIVSSISEKNKKFVKNEVVLSNSKPAFNSLNRCTKSQHAHDSVPDPNLLPEGAKDYISRSEFALNPFVFSSLSSSEPDSSISSASSLTSTSCIKNGKMNIIDNDSVCKGSMPHHHCNTSCLIGDLELKGDALLCQKNEEQKIILSSSYLSQEKPVEACSKVQNQHNTFQGTEDDANINGDCAKECLVIPSPLIFSVEGNKEYVDSNSPDTLTTSSNMSHSSKGETLTTLILLNTVTSLMRNETGKNDVANIHPQSHSEVQQRACIQTEISHESPRSIKSSLDKNNYKQDCSQDTLELASSDGHISKTYCKDETIMMNNVTTLPSSISSQPANKHELIVYGECMIVNPQKENEKLANISMPNLSLKLPGMVQSPSKTFASDPKSTNNSMIEQKRIRAEKECGAVSIALTAIQAYSYNTSASMMDDEYDDDVCHNDEKMNYSFQAPRKITIQQSESGNFSCNLKGLTWREGEENASEENVKGDIKNDSSPSPPLTSLPDNSLLSNGNMKKLENLSSFSSSSSGSGDEQSDILQQRFQRQRSDSESEYEAAEFAMEENNLDMAYDIIVNSPSKRKSQMMPLSDVAGDVKKRPSSSFLQSRSFAQAQKCERHHIADVPHHSQSQDKTNQNTCFNNNDDVKSGAASTLSNPFSAMVLDTTIMNASGIYLNDESSDCRKEGVETVESNSIENATKSTMLNESSRNISCTHKKLPVFESSIDDCLNDDDATDTTCQTVAALNANAPETRQSSSSSFLSYRKAQPAHVATATTEWQKLSSSSSTFLAHNKREDKSSPTHEIGNTSLLLLHHQQQQRVEYSKLQHELPQRKECQQSSDELLELELTTAASLPASTNSRGVGDGAGNNAHCSNRTIIGSGYSTAAFGSNSKGEEQKSNINFCVADGPSSIRKQEEPVIIHQQHHHHNVLSSVTLGDSTSEDVTRIEHNLRKNHKRNSSGGSGGCNNASHPVASGDVLHKTSPPSNCYCSTENNNYNNNTNQLTQQIASTRCGGSSNNNYSHNHSYTASSDKCGDTVTNEESNRGYHENDPHSSKLVITDPYDPNELGVAQVKKFLSGYVAQNCEEFVQFSGLDEPPSQKISSLSSSASPLNYSGKQKENSQQQQLRQLHQQHHQTSQSLTKNPNLSERSTKKASVESCSDKISTQVKTGRERVILGDSNFGFFGCSFPSHSQNTSSVGVAQESGSHDHEPVLNSYACSSTNLLPQVNLDLHAISSNASSAGYGFPSCSIPITAESTTFKALHRHRTRPSPPPVPPRKEQSDRWQGNKNNESQQEQQRLLLVPLKEENNFHRNPNTNASVKRSASPLNNPISQELSKDQPSLRRDRENRQQLHNHLHVEDINLYADQFSVPLGAIKAAVVAVAPAASIPSSILVGSSEKNNFIDVHASSSSHKNQSEVILFGSSNTRALLPLPASHSSCCEENVNLSTLFKKGTTKTCTERSDGINHNNITSSNVLALPKGVEKKDIQKSVVETVASTTIVPDILLLKSESLTSRQSEKSSEILSIPSKEKERKNLQFDNSKDHVIPCNFKGKCVSRVEQNGEQVATATEAETNSNDKSSLNLAKASANAADGTSNDSKGNKSSFAFSCNNSSAVEIEMLRSDSPSSSSVPSGLPLKTKTYGPRNEVEIVVVSSRTPSPAPGGFVVTSSSSSSLQLPPSLSTSSEQNRNNGGQRQTPVFSFEGCRHKDSTEPGSENDAVAKSPPPSLSPSSSSNEQQSTRTTTRSRVHFSPVVSEISWRESYIDQSSECESSTDDLQAKLEVLDTASAENRLNDNSGNLRKADAAAVVYRPSIGDSLSGSGDCDSGSSTVRPLQVCDIEMSTRTDSLSEEHVPAVKGLILAEKVEMTKSNLQNRNVKEVNKNVLLGDEGHSHTVDKLLLINDDDNNHKLHDNDQNNPERVTDLVDFRSAMNDGRNGNYGNDKNCASDENSCGTFGLYEDVEIQIEPTTQAHASTTLSMVPDLLCQCETTHNTLTHIDVKIEEAVPNISSKNIVLNIGPTRLGPPRDNQSQCIQPIQQEPKQIFPKMFENCGTQDKRYSSSSSSTLSGSSKDKKKISKGFLISGLSSGIKKPENGGLKKDNNDTGNTLYVNAVCSGNGSKDSGNDSSKENKKLNKPSFFGRLSKIRLSGGSKAKKQKVHPRLNELDQEQKDPKDLPTAVSGSATISSTSEGKPIHSVNKNGDYGDDRNNTTAQVQIQPILKKPSKSAMSMGMGTNYNEMGLLSGDSENEPDDATQAFENILEEIAGLKSIQLRQEKSSSSSIEKSINSPSQQVRSFAKRRQFYNSATSPSPPVSPTSQNSRSYQDLDSKLIQFKEETHRNLESISKSHPDLEKMEDVVKQRQSLFPEPSKNYEKVLDTEYIHRPGISATLPKMSSPPKSPSQAAQEHAQNREREWYRLLKSAAEKYSHHSKGSKDDNFTSSSLKTGIVETDLDTGASREMLDEDVLMLECYSVCTTEVPITCPVASTSTSISIAPNPVSPAAKTRSLTNLSSRLPLSIAPSQFDDTGAGDLSDSEERAKSLEFLLDESHKSSSVPPENKLRQLEARQLSEHELRIQRSLQRLNVPEWYKQHEAISIGANNVISGPSLQVKPGSILKRSEYGSSGGLAGGWTGLSTYKAPSMSSLQSNNEGRSSGAIITNKSNFVRGRPATMSVTTRTSKESLLAGSTNHSPSAFERSSFTYGMPFTMTRFGQGRLGTHSSSVSPPSTPGSSTKTTYVKKPYLGWRSQEKLNAAIPSGAHSGTSGPPKLSIYLPPAERLAADLLATRAKSPVRLPPVSDRPPLPKASPRSGKTQQLSSTRAPVTLDDSMMQVPCASSSFPQVTHQRKSSTAVVTKLPPNLEPSSIPPPELFESSGSNIIANLSQSSTTNKIQSTKVSSQDVHDSIRQVTNAISHYVHRGHADQSHKAKPKSGKKQAVWIESSFVGQKSSSN